MADLTLPIDDHDGYGEKRFLEVLETEGLPDFIWNGKDLRQSYLESANQKWNASSALQKAIRRGDRMMALRLAAALHKLDPQYIAKRLHVVAVEDIGLADPDVMAMYHFGAGKKMWRQQHGGDLEVFLKLIDMMVSANKSRDADDLHMYDGMRGGPTYAAIHAELHNQPADKLLQVIADPFGEGWERAVIAARYLYGKGNADEANPTFYPRTVDSPHPKDALIAICEAIGVPEYVKWLVLGYSSRTYELQFMMLPFAWLRMHCSGGLEIADDPLSWTSHLVKGFPDYALDWHTQSGKRALAYFNKSSGIIDLYEKAKLPMGKWVETTGMAIFSLEGQTLIRRERNDFTAELLSDIRMLRLQREGLNPAFVEEAYQVVLENAEKLYYARAKIEGAVTKVQ